MSDILIKNMEIPRNCVECFCMNNCDAHAIMMGKLLEKGCENFMAEFRKGRLEGCPLVKIKLHGRLIDADKLRMKYEYGAERKKVDKAPTVLEASK